MIVTFASDVETTLRYAAHKIPVYPRDLVRV